MDNLEERRTVFYKNLLLLGFDGNYVEGKYNVTCNRDMFLVPNKKGFEVVSHFLFSKLDSVCPDQFLIVWPLFEKSHEHKFRKTCFEYLTKIAKENTFNVRFPRIFQTIFLSPGGDRFYELYLAFSTYVLLKIIQKNKICKPLCRPSVISQCHEQAKQNFQLSTLIATTEFLNVQHSSIQHEKNLQKQAQNLIRCYRRMKQNIVLMQKKIAEKKRTLYSSQLMSESGSSSSGFNMNMLFEKYGSLIYEVLCTCCCVNSCLLKEKSLWDVIRTELRSNSLQKIILDGQKFLIEITPSLKTKCMKNFIQKRIQFIGDNEKLIFSSFLDVCCIAFEYYKQEFDRVGFPLTPAQNMVEKNIEILDHNLKAFEACRKSAVESLPHIKKSVEILESSIPQGVLNSTQTIVPFSHLTSNLTFTPDHIAETVSHDKLFLFTPPSGNLQSQAMNLHTVDHNGKVLKESLEKEGYPTPDPNPFAHESSDADLVQKSNFLNLKNLCVNDIQLYESGRDADVKSCIAQLGSCSSENGLTEDGNLQSHSKTDQVVNVYDSFLFDAEDVKNPVYENLVIHSQVKEVGSESEGNNWLAEEELLDNITLPAIPNF